MGDNRKPLVMAGVLAAVLVMAFVLAAGFGGRHSNVGPGWVTFLRNMASSASLQPDDLRVVEGDCEVSGSLIEVVGACVLGVPGHGGGAAIADAVTQATIVAMDGPMQLTVVVEGTTVSQRIDERTRTRLTFGTSGGELGLACLTFGDFTCSALLGQ